jgi:nitroimidazol reductase NimA-like FMN-containing flavoprotein (pyridoxamine 5'-phosphate oxidase superfamily)
MPPDPASDRPELLARALLEQNSYLTLATANAAGVPWASPVWFAARDLGEFVWASKPGSRHSCNIAERPLVSLVIFDSSKKPGEGSALYLTADAELVHNETFDQALELYNERSAERGLPAWDPAQLREPARHRLYRAITLEAFVLDDRDERVSVPVPNSRPLDSNPPHSHPLEDREHDRGGT